MFPDTTPPSAYDTDDVVMLPDGAAVEQAIRAAAAAEAMPRFGNLTAGDIHEKRPNDPVTAADLAMEAALRQSLGAIAPDAAFVGEEGFETDPETVERLDAAAGAWIVDPIDGTKNFAKGDPCFAVIVAFARYGETHMGWIYDPTTDSMLAGVRGQGATLDGDPAVPRCDTPGVGYVARSLRERMANTGPEAWPADKRPDLPFRLGCAGHEYRRLVTGEAAFARFGGRPKPWDHAAGTLILAEAGGRHGMVDDGGRPYRPGRGVCDGVLLCACDLETWETAAKWMAMAG